jgi:hypothetical protein
VGFGIAEAQGSLPSASPGKMAAGTDPAKKTLHHNTRKCGAACLSLSKQEPIKRCDLNHANRRGGRNSGDRFCGGAMRIRAEAP